MIRCEQATKTTTHKTAWSAQRPSRWGGQACTHTRLQPLHSHTAHSWLLAHRPGATLGDRSSAVAGPLYLHSRYVACTQAHGAHMHRGGHRSSEHRGP